MVKKFHISLASIPLNHVWLLNSEGSYPLIKCKDMYIFLTHVQFLSNLKYESRYINFSKPSYKLVVHMSLVQSKLRVNQFLFMYDVQRRSWMCIFHCIQLSKFMKDFFWSPQLLQNNMKSCRERLWKSGNRYF